MIKNGLSRVFMACLCVLSLLTSFAQGKRVSGTITDDKAAPLVGATVSVKGTTVLTTTNNSGAFSLDVPSNGKTLVISYVGMQPKEVEIGNQTTINTTLSGTGSTLSDVVVIGYGTARRANLTTAQSTVGAKEIEK